MTDAPKTSGPATSGPATSGRAASQAMNGRTASVPATSAQATSDRATNSQTTSGRDLCPALAVKGLIFSHQGGEALPSLASLDFSLAPGRALCLAGVNGSGKSTLLALLAGLYVCRAGLFTVFGHDMAGDETSRRRGAAYSALLMQDPDLQILGASAGEDLMLGMDGDDTAPERALALARRFALDAALDMPVQHLSYGQKRKLCLATALMRRPKLLLLDEPFSGLDYPAVKELRIILRDLKEEGASLVIGSHDLEPLLDFCDAALFLSTEGPCLFGPLAEIAPRAEGFGVRPPRGGSIFR